MGDNKTAIIPRFAVGYTTLHYDHSGGYFNVPSSWGITFTPSLTLEFKIFKNVSLGVHAAYDYCWAAFAFPRPDDRDWWIEYDQRTRWYSLHLYSGFF